MPSRRLGQYELEYQLGAPSGMGSVYVAKDVDLRREVAIKELLPHLSRDPDFAARFRAEAENLARLSHPNITTLYSLGREGESEFMVMELIRGQTLKDVMKRLRVLGVRESLAVVAQAAAGLAYAHRMGVIHRDIKPSNIMVTNDGLLKIMDFGISRVRGSQRQTRDGGIVGTLLYISPEQLRSAEGDERSDMYSLAITLYEMLTGDPPFRADNEYELMRMHLETPPAPMSTRLPSIDPKLDAAVCKALAKNPDDRFPSIDAFARALGTAAVQGEAVDILCQCLADAFDADATIVHRLPPTITGTGSRASAAPGGSLGGSLGGSVGGSVGGAPGSTFGSSLLAPPPSRAEEVLPVVAPPRRGRGRAVAALVVVLALLGAGAGYMFLPADIIAMVTGRPQRANGPGEQAARQELPAASPSRQADVPVSAPITAPPVTSPPVTSPPVTSPPATEPPHPTPMPQVAVAPPVVEPEPPRPPPSRQPESPIATPTVPPTPEPPPQPTPSTPQATAPVPVPVPVPAPAPVPVPAPVAAPAPPPVTVVPPAPEPVPPAPPAVVEPAPSAATQPAPPAATQQAMVRPPAATPSPDTPRVVPPPVVPSPVVPPVSPATAPAELPVVEGIVSAAAGTHAVMIGGRFITLFGIEPNSPSPAQFDKDRLIVEKLVRGMLASCYERPRNRFKCMGSNGQDLAMLVLKAGVVRPSRDAPPEYRSAR